jgi:hypothetical protein
MAYRIEVSDTADAEADRAYIWLSRRSPDTVRILHLRHAAQRYQIDAPDLARVRAGAEAIAGQVLAELPSVWEGVLERRSRLY